MLETKKREAGWVKEAAISIEVKLYELIRIYSSDASEVVSMKRPFPEDSPQSTKQSKNKRQTGECICTVCQDPILDATKTSKGQDSIFCEGQCSAWIHTWCASLSKSVFNTLAIKVRSTISLPPLCFTQSCIRNS